MVAISKKIVHAALERFRTREYASIHLVYGIPSGHIRPQHSVAVGNQLAFFLAARRSASLAEETVVQWHGKGW